MVYSWEQRETLRPFTPDGAVTAFGATTPSFFDGATATSWQLAIDDEEALAAQAAQLVCLLNKQ